jgi:hypothetical protein
MNRRKFLRGVGGVLLATPFLSSIGAPKMQAQTVPDPKRLIILFQPNGVNPLRFWPTVTNGAITEASLSGRALQPLTPYYQQLLVPRGLHMSPRGYGYDGIAGCDHRKGMVCKLTAMPTYDDGRNYAMGHSVDFEAARSINAGGRDPLVLQVGRRIDPSSGSATDFCSFSAPGVPYPGENNPWNVYRSLSGMIPGGEAEDLVVRKRRSVADLVREDLTELQRLPMSTEDQRHIDAWLSLVRDTENMMMATCGPETPGTLMIPSLARYEGMTNNQVGGDPEYAAVADIMMKLVALATVCDMNRVCTVQFSRGSGGPTFRWDGMNHDFNHHQISHRNGRDDDQGPDLSGVEDMITAVDTWYAGRMAELCRLLSMFQEGSGSALYNSAIVWMNELTDGKAHSFNNMPVVIAGSAGGYLRQGQVVNCSASGNLEAVTGAPHNKLLTTLLNAVGARAPGGGPVTSFGDLTYGQTGEYAQLKA